MNNAKILIIEDNIVTLGDLEMRINQMGYENIATAVSGEEAIEIADAFNPDLILSDINLGKGITGIEAVRLIKQKHDVPVVYLTAYDDDKTLTEAGITEPYAYLLKPLQERELRISLSIAQYKHRTERELKEANATKERFFSILAHDLRNPLSSLLGFSNLLLEDFNDYGKEEIKEYIDLINQSANHTYNLLNSLLEWSKSRRGMTPFNPQKIDFYLLLTDAYMLMNNLAKAKQITVELDVPEKLCSEADEEMLKTVIRNLLGNAIKFTPENGTIKIFAKKTLETVQIEISDTGIGMDEKTKNSLFKIDENQSREGTNGEHGTGFGLLLCKDFIDKHKGTITVESELAKGTTFIISLPAT